MTEPKRLIEQPGDEFERKLLGSSRIDEPGSAALARTAAALGVGSAVLAGAPVANGAAAGATAGKLGALAVVKWLAVGLTAGGLAVAGVELARDQEPGARPQRATPVNEPRQANVARVVKPAAKTDDPAAGLPLAVPQPAPAAPRELRRTPARAEGDARGGAEQAPSARFDDLPAPVSAPAASSIAAEVSALDRARGALAARRPADALRALDEYDRRAAPRVLAQEAAVLRVEALILAGNRPAAAALAGRLLAAAPNSPHAPRWQTIASEQNP